MELNETAKQLRRAANFFQGIIGAADALDELGSIKQATKEAGDALHKVRLELTAEHQSLIDSKAEVKAAREQARALMDAATKTAKASREASEQAAMKAKSDLGAALETQTLNAKANADAELARQNHTLRAVEAAIQELRATQADLLQAIDVKSAELDAIEARIAAAKATISQMLG